MSNTFEKSTFLITKINRDGKVAYLIEILLDLIFLLDDNRYYIKRLCALFMQEYEISISLKICKIKSLHVLKPFISSIFAIKDSSFFFKMNI